MPNDAEGPKIDRVREALEREGDEEDSDGPDLGDPPLERVTEEAERTEDGEE